MVNIKITRDAQIVSKDFIWITELKLDWLSVKNVQIIVKLAALLCGALSAIMEAITNFNTTQLKEIYVLHQHNGQKWMGNGQIEKLKTMLI